jgi:hypothetical protein
MRRKVREGGSGCRAAAPIERQQTIESSVSQSRRRMPCVWRAGLDTRPWYDLHQTMATVNTRPWYDLCLVIGALGWAQLGVMHHKLAIPSIDGMASAVERERGRERGRGRGRGRERKRERARERERERKRERESERDGGRKGRLSTHRLSTHRLSTLRQTLPSIGGMVSLKVWASYR